MPFISRKSALVLGLLTGAALVAAGGFVWSGVYNIGADDIHTRPVFATLQTLRDRSIAVRANQLQRPADLDDPARIRQGAGNYNAMCTGCHLGPGMQATELSKGLYPEPPNLSKQAVEAGEAFWVIKHGIKASGMPAWGKSMGDEYIWNMAAFLQVLPTLTPDQYQSLVASSGGHAHGGGESGGHAHAAAGTGHDDGGASPEPGDRAPHAHPPGTPLHTDAPPQTTAVPERVHVHPDGKAHVHAAKPAAAGASAPDKSAAPDASHGSDSHASEAAGDGHDHRH